jgi:hypothetical protein
MSFSPEKPRSFSTVETVRLLNSERASIEVHNALAAAEVPHVFVKGAATRYLLYADPRERPAADVDVRIQASNTGRARRALEGLPAWSTRSASKVYETFQGQIYRTNVDVESAVGWPHFSSFSTERLLRVGEAPAVPNESALLT